MEDKIKSEITQLFNDHADYLFNFAISRVNDTHIAEDLVQETFVSALKSYQSFKGDSKASTWLIAILKNKIIDYYRKKVKEYKKDSLDELSRTNEFFDDSGKWMSNQKPQKWQFDSPPELNQKEFYETLQNCLGKLKELQRIAFVMKHLEDAETEEICKELNITSSNYWVIIHRAKLQLRKCLETHWIKA